MANLQDRITKLGKYFVGFNIGQAPNGDQVIYLELTFPKGWGVSTKVKDKFGVGIAKTKREGGYYFYGSLTEVGFDNIFDAADFNIKANEEAQEKKNFLVEKVKELQKIVDEEDMSTLRTLEFKYKKKTVKQPQKQTKQSVGKTDEENKDEIETNE